jgi:hypothetical protein
MPTNAKTNRDIQAMVGMFIPLSDNFINRYNEKHNDTKDIIKTISIGGFVLKNPISASTLILLPLWFH